MEEVPITDIIKLIVKEIVDAPEELEFNEIIGNSSIIVGIKSQNPKNIAQIIGKKGSTIVAIKQIIEQISRKRQIRCTIYVD